MHKTTFSKKYVYYRLQTFLFVAAYAYCLFYIYGNFIVGIFVEYPEAVYSFDTFFIATAFVFLSAWTIPLSWTKPSTLYYSLIVIGVYIPMCVLFASSEQSSEYFYSVSFAVFLVRMILSFKKLAVLDVRIDERIVWVAIGSVLIITYAWVILTGYSSFSLSFVDVYMYRQELNEEYSGALGYLIPLIGKVIIPGLCAYFLFRGKYAGVLMMVFLGLLLFPLTSHKAYLIFAVAPVFIKLMMSTKKPLLFIMASLLLVLAFVIYLVVAYDNIWGVALIPQRGIMKPAMLNYVWYEYFKNLDPILLSNSALNPFVDYKYDAPPSFLVGEFLKDSLDTRSNTGFLGTGYAHFGIIGPVLFALVVGVILWGLDSISSGLPCWFVHGLTFGAFSSMLVASDLVPSLFTQGVLSSIAFIMVVRFHLLKHVLDCEGKIVTRL